MAETVRPALGRGASIGMLYNAKSDRFLNVSLLPSDLPPEWLSTTSMPHTETLQYTCTSFRMACEALQVDQETAVNILCGLVRPQGASVFLRDYLVEGGGGYNDGDDALLGIITHQFSTMQQRLGNFGEAFKFSRYMNMLMSLETNDCTHLVIGVSWGLKNVVAITRSASGSTSPADQDAFGRDLEAMASAIASDDPSSRNHGPDTSNQAITFYSDALDNVAIVMQNTGDVRDFVSLGPTQIKQQNNGKGWQMSYTLIPVNILFHLAQGSTSLPMPLESTLNPSIFSDFIEAFDVFNASETRLRQQAAHLARHRTYVAESSIREVAELRDNFERFKKWASHELLNILGGVRRGEKEDIELSDFSNYLASCNHNLRNAFERSEEAKTKLDFILSVVAKGATYIGFNGATPDMVSKAQRNGHYHVFHFNAGSMQQTKEWNDNVALLHELVGSKPSTPVYIFDYDAIDPDTNIEGPRISSHKGNSETTQDVLEKRQFLASKCFARCNTRSVDSRKYQRPIKRRFVKIPCPCQSDPSAGLEWTCPACFAAFEFGFTDSFFYCECGRSLYTSYRFKCNDPNHGAGYTPFDDAEHLHNLLMGLDQSDYINILILGETGVGKSTFINAFVNYLSYSTLDEAKASEGLTTVIPCAFSLQTMDRANPQMGIQEYTINVGSRDDEADGSKGDSATQKTAVYPVTIGAKTYRLIDTPGIGDTRGVSFDKKNMADILATISSYDELHGILILLKSNNSRLTITFRFCVKELLAHLHRNAAETMAFGFTNTRISNYTPGDTFKPLKALLNDHADVGLSLTTSTTYCFDSESFRYLAAYKQNVPVPNEEDFRRSWDHSRQEALRLLDYFASTKPHPVSSTLSLNGTRKLISELTAPMARISDMVVKNIRLLEDRKKELVNTKLSGAALHRKLLIERIQFEARQLDRPRTVCKRSECCDFKDSGKGDGEIVTIYKTHCHAECYLENVTKDVVADPGLIGCWAFEGSGVCRICYHRWQEHLHILYELDEVKVRVKDTEIERQLKENADSVTLRQTGIAQLDNYIKEYKDELHEIRRAAARFCVFLKQNAITPVNDATLEYIELLIADEKNIVDMGKEKRMSTEANERHLQALEDDKRVHLELVEAFKQSMHDPKGPEDMLLDEQGVDALVKKLYRLKHFGANLKDVKYVIDSSIEGTYRERPYRVQKHKPRPSPSIVDLKRSKGHQKRGKRHESSSPEPDRLETRRTYASAARFRETGWVPWSSWSFFGFH